MFFHYHMSRNPEIWQDGDKFIPERYDRSTFTADSPEKQLIAIPFGFGTRGCIGKRTTCHLSCQQNNTYFPGYHNQGQQA